MKDPRQKPVVFFGVDQSETDPAQSLLHDTIGAAAEIRPGSLADALAAQNRNAASVIYHLYNDELIFRLVPPTENRRAAVQSFLRQISQFLDVGGTLIWTRNTLELSDAFGTELYAELVGHLNALSAIVHVHTHQALQALEIATPPQAHKSVVISGGNYFGAYNYWSREAARERLELEPASFVFSMYHPFDENIDAQNGFAAFSELAPDGAVFLTPKQFAGETCPGIRKIAPPEDQRNSTLFAAAADAVVVPSLSTLSPNLALFFASVGRGVIAPDCAGINGIFRDGHSGLLFDRGDPHGLLRSMRIALNEGAEVWKQRGRNARVMATCHDWSGPARLWSALYRTLGGLPRPGTVELGASIERTGS